MCVFTFFEISLTLLSLSLNFSTFVCLLFFFFFGDLFGFVSWKCSRDQRQRVWLGWSPKQDRGMCLFLNAELCLFGSVR